MDNFNEIYKKYYRSAYNTIKKIVKNDLDAEEITNEAMIRVHKNYKSFNQDLSKFSTWVFNIAKNAAIDFVRKKRLNTIALEDVHTEWANGDEAAQTDHLMALKSDENNPEELMVEQEVRRTLYDQFKTLNENDQLVATLHYFDGLSYEEVSTELGLPLGTVKAKIHKARVKLMDAFPQEMRKLSLIER